MFLTVLIDGSDGSPPKGSTPPTHNAAAWKEKLSHPKKPTELRCERCQHFYTEEMNRETSCCYHSGRFRSIVSGGSGLINMSQAKKWSCCKKIEESAIGCRSGPHEEDVEFTHFLIDSYSNLEHHSAFTSSTSTPHMPPRIARSQQQIPQQQTQQQQQQKQQQQQQQQQQSQQQQQQQQQPQQQQFPSQSPSLLEEDKERENKDREENSESEEEVPKGYQRHFVVETDSMSRLCLAYDVSAEAIKVANQIVNDQEIHSRTFLLIPR
jgi:hypothetical protein